MMSVSILILRYRLRRLNANMNCLTATLPVGGMKGSGWGSNNAKWGIHEFLIPKLVTVNMKEVVSFV